jgi:hypothetical protein
MVEYKLFKKEVINGKKRNIYKKKGSNKQYIKSKGKMMNLAKYKKLIKNKKLKKGGSYYRYIDTTKLPEPKRRQVYPRLLQPQPVKKIPSPPPEDEEHNIKTRKYFRRRVPEQRHSSSYSSHVRSSTPRAPNPSPNPEYVKTERLNMHVRGNLANSSDCKGKNDGTIVNCNYDGVQYPGICINQERCLIEKSKTNTRNSVKSKKYFI